MSQNFAVQGFKTFLGGLGFANLDKFGAILHSTKNQVLKVVAASATKTVLGATGAVGDAIGTVLIAPATTTPGAVTLYDGSGSTGVVLFAGGTVADIKPFQITVNATAAAATNPGWFISTGANVSVVVSGNFT